MGKKPSENRALVEVLGQQKVIGEDPAPGKRWLARSLELKPEQLVHGWPSNKWVGYQNREHPDQIERALAPAILLLKQWLAGLRSDMPGFLFHGPVGRGKTGVALMLALEAARRGCQAIFVTAAQAVAERNSTSYARKEGETQLDLRSRYHSYAVVILDDVCARQYTGTEREFILDLVRGIEADGGIVLLTTNLELNMKKGNVYPDRETFELWLDGRVLSTYKGWAFDAGEWGESLRGRDDQNSKGEE